MTIDTENIILSTPFHSIYSCYLFIRAFLFYMYISFIAPTYSILLYCIGLSKDPSITCAFIVLSTLDTKLITYNETPLITNGVILTNHRSIADFYIDIYLFHCAAIGRYFAVFMTGFNGILAYFWNKVICINRNLSRHAIYSKIQQHSPKLWYYYPEETRCSHLTLPTNYTDVPLKTGLLKSIYEDTNNTPIQIVISKNKEHVINEKKLHIGFEINVYSIIGEPIYTRDYATFELFLDKLKLDWHTLWNTIYFVHSELFEKEPLIIQ